jgi:enoyl-CoA hydratase/carnithine racemase
MDASDGRPVIVDDDTSVRWVLLNRPKRHNAIDIPTAEAWTAYAEPLGPHLSREAEEMGLAADTPEFEEGSLAFFERRAPRF